MHWWLAAAVATAQPVFLGFSPDGAHASLAVLGAGRGPAVSTVISAATFTPVPEVPHVPVVATTTGGPQGIEVVRDRARIQLDQLGIDGRVRGALLDAAAEADGRVRLGHHGTLALDASTDPSDCFGADTVLPAWTLIRRDGSASPLLTEHDPRLPACVVDMDLAEARLGPEGALAMTIRVDYVAAPERVERTFVLVAGSTRPGPVASHQP